MINREYALPLSRQWLLLNLSRSSLCHDAVAGSARDLELMRLIAENSSKVAVLW